MDRDLDEGPARYGPRPVVARKIDRFREMILVQSEQYPRLSATRLHEEIRAAGYAGGYTQVKEYVREVRPGQTPDPVVRFETPPGPQTQVDFAEFRLPWGKRYALLVVLGYSRLLWLQFYPRQTLSVLTQALECNFDAFGGVPVELLSTVLPQLLDTVPDPHYEDLLNRIETALERACAAIIAGAQSVEEDDRRRQGYIHPMDFDAPTVAGAVHAWGWSITRASKWLEAALTEAAISGGGSLTEHFAMALAMEAPPAAAALALNNLSALLERNVRGGRLNRPLLPHLLRACLIVATQSGPAGEDLFDQLVLSCAQDSSFANLATAILEIGAPALEMARSWMTRALREGRPARCAGAITLAGYLSQDLADAETVLRSCGRENAYLRAVARQAKDCSVRSDRMKGWYRKRLESFDSVEAGVMEFLALHDATGVAPAAPLGELAGCSSCVCGS